MIQISWEEYNLPVRLFYWPASLNTNNYHGQRGQSLVNGANTKLLSLFSEVPHGVPAFLDHLLKQFADVLE